MSYVSVIDVQIEIRAAETVLLFIAYLSHHPLLTYRDARYTEITEKHCVVISDGIICCRLPKQSILTDHCTFSDGCSIFSCFRFVSVHWTVENWLVCITYFTQ